MNFLKRKDPRGPNFGPLRSTASLFRDIRLLKRKYSEWRQNYLKHLMSKFVLYILSTFPWGPSFSQVLIDDQGLLRPKFLENQKIGNAPITPDDLEFTLYTLSTYLWGSNFGLFCFKTSRFGDTRLSKIVKIRKVPNDIRKVTCIHEVFSSETQSFVRFALRPGVFEILHIL